MANYGNARVVKRKGGSNEPKLEPVKKALKKNEILQQYEVLQQKYSILVEKHDNVVQ